MGRATIISHLGAGQYRVQPDFDTVRLLAMITGLSDELTLISNRLSDLTGEINSARLAADYAQQVLNAALTNGDTEDIKTTTAANRTAVILLASLQQTQVLLRLRKLAAEKRQAWLESYNQAQLQIDLWCADLTDDLTGEVATVEVGRQSTAQLLRPGHGGSAVYDAVRDGQHQALAGSTPNGVFYNAAMRPGTEKWRPCYRTGTITALDTGADTASVTLDVASSDQGIDINQTATLTDIPVQYMTCNAKAFNTGDHVLIEFVGRLWSGAQVVGFVDNPQACFGWVLAAIDYSSHSLPDSMGRYELNNMIVEIVNRPAGAADPSTDEVIIGTAPTVEPVDPDPTAVLVSRYLSAMGEGWDAIPGTDYLNYYTHPYKNATRPDITAPVNLAAIEPDPDRVIAWPNGSYERWPIYWAGRLLTYKWQSIMAISASALGGNGEIINGSAFAIAGGVAPYTWSIQMESALPAINPACLVQAAGDAVTASIVAPTTYDLPVGRGAIICTDVNGLTVAVDVEFGTEQTYLAFNNYDATLPVWDWHWDGLNIPAGDTPPWQLGVVYLKDNDKLYVLEEGGDPYYVNGVLMDGFLATIIAYASGGETAIFYRLVTEAAGNVKQLVTEGWWVDNSTAEHAIPAGFAQSRISGSDVDATGLVLRSTHGTNTAAQ